MNRSFWSCFTHVDDTELRTYDDALGRVYEYDSNVVNHARISVGDVLVLRDRHLVLGYGIVDSITQEPGTKVMRRCPTCSSSRLVERKTAVPRWRCAKCTAVFDSPMLVPADVKLYRASYESWWMPFPATPRTALDAVYAGADRQNAIRNLSSAPAAELIQRFSGVEGRLHLALLEQRHVIEGGFVEIMARRRVNQSRFRDALLQRHGSVCAVTGAQPEVVLDAAHLIQYAHRPLHDPRAGLLLRADVHRLFDRLLLTIDPDDQRTIVAPPLLQRHAHLDVLTGRELTVRGHRRPERELLARHHEAALVRWRDIA